MFVPYWTCIERGCRSVLFGVAIVAIVACGSGAPTTDGDSISASSMVAIDSLPGETVTTAAVRPPVSVTSTTPEDAVTNPPRPLSESLPEDENSATPAARTVTGAGVLAAKGFSDFSGQRVGLVANRASVVGQDSVIDLLVQAPGVDLAAIFAPEHGLRADAGAGEDVSDGVDPVTGLPVYSLYGAVRSPTPESLNGLDVMVFDLQDVGTRYYTYTATMGLAMQAAAEAGIPFVVLDRPNPLSGATSGHVRDESQTSFVSQYPIPSLHGMTAGELALAIKGEAWLEGLADLDLRVVPLSGWSPDMIWAETDLAWVPPSPGLPTVESAMAYPALVLFEATPLSFGRGTDHPFQQVGAPWLDGSALAAELNGSGLRGVRFEAVTFTPQASLVAKEPQFEGQELSGVRVEVVDGRVADQAAVAIHLLSAVMGQAADEPTIDRGEFLDLLTGTPAVRQMLESGESAEDIVASWSDDLAAFEQIRAKYRLY